MTTLVANRAPEIYTERLTLRPFSERDLTPEYVAWLNDPEVVRFSEQRHKTHTLESCREYMESFDDSPNHFWAIGRTLRPDGNALIGTMTAYVDQDNNVADLGIMIGDKPVWGQGLGTEAWKAVCAQLFADGVRKVAAGTLETHHAMRAIFRKAGMEDDGRRVGQTLWQGKEVDVVYAALFNTGF